tara:strand:- start:12922 stop:13125 length:204 start_codon:yes stop_codon:yes gene_type:complete
MSSDTTKNSDSPAPKKKAAVIKPDQMDAEVIAFITAIDDYKRVHSRPFPTWSEVLKVLKDLGYKRAA